MSVTSLDTPRTTAAFTRLRLDAAEADRLDQLLDETLALAGDAHEEDLVTLARDAARRVPARLCSTLDAMRLWERPSGLLVSGCRVDDAAIGPTPASWRSAGRRVREELLLLVLTAALGEPYAWSTQQGGRLVHDILPTRGDEHVQLGSSSATELLWHTEDAFHELRCDYLALLCLRNDEQVGTTVAVPDLHELSAETRRALAEPRFHILPDDSHLSARNPGHLATPGLADRFEDVERRLTDPTAVSLLFGPPDRPYLRIDPAYMAPVPGDELAARALAEAYALVERSLRDVALAPGDVLVLDNYRGVHGRRPFRARYDGRDRWLKRVSVTRDLRRQRIAADSSTSWTV
ncbi:guanitoxin biosynthesis L-enduracididine beta-hydroxylase GntD [Kitasatospora sp. NPDC049258]|uniref:guanitoxin biosynthesis L-enduracididine beta-hydroxylase GntD n=1 Tax=Kitasatospora sp. NPDC049258 TaxID=3155394 RepID=UPI0034296078